MKTGKRVSKIVLIMLIVMVAMTSFVFAGGAEHSSSASKAIGLRWTGLNSCEPSFDILSGGKASPYIFCTTYTGKVDSVNVVVDLKKQKGSSWTSVKSWDQNMTVVDNSFTFDETYKVSRGTYKYNAKIKTYKGGRLLDTVNIESSQITY